MSGFNKNSDNQEFIKKLELLRDLEAEKPVEEMDVSLVMACVELILELRGETVNFTPEEVEEKVRKIPFVEETTTLNTPPQSVKGRSTKVKSRKILLIAAIISILIAIFAVTSIAFDWNIFDELKNRFGTVANAPVNENIEVRDITVVSNGNTIKYKDLKEALINENLDVLYPNKLPKNIILEQIVFDKLDMSDRVAFVFNSCDFTYFVKINEKVSDDVIFNATEIVNINGLKCYLVYIESVNVSQVYFEYKGNLYFFSFNNKQELIDTIENLKELQ